MNKLILAAAIAASAVSFSASAADLTFNNFNFTYQQADFDCDTNCDGLGISASGEINEIFFFGGSYIRYDIFGDDVNAYNVFIGARNEFSENAAVYGKLGVAKVNTDFGSSDTELAAAVGIRAMLTPSFELDGSINYVNADDSDPTANLTGTFYFTDAVGASLFLDGGDGFFGGGVGVRVNF